MEIKGKLHCFFEEIKQIESVSDFRWEENQKLKKENEELKNKIETQYQENQTLGNNNTKLLDKIQSLKAQIEKMKCCQMCKHLENRGSCLKANKKEVKEWGNFLIETRRTHYCTNWELVE